MKKSIKKSMKNSEKLIKQSNTLNKNRKSSKTTATQTSQFAKWIVAVFLVIVIIAITLFYLSSTSIGQAIQQTRQQTQIITIPKLPMPDLNAQCFDSDNGMNETIGGYTLQKGELPVADVCLRENGKWFIQEYTCVEGKRINKTLACNNKCIVQQTIIIQNEELALMACE